MAAYLWSSFEIGKQVFTDMKSIPTVFKYRDNFCLAGHWKGVNFDIFVVKYKKYNIIMMSTKSGLVVREDKKWITNIKRKDVQIPVYITLFLSLIV